MGDLSDARASQFIDPGRRSPCMVAMVMTLPMQPTASRRWKFSPDIAVWYHNGLPVVPLRRALVRDLRGRFEPPAMLRTELIRTPEAILLRDGQRFLGRLAFPGTPGVGPSE